MSVRLIPSLEKDPLLVARCQRPAGRWALLAVFSLLLTVFGREWLAVAAFLAFTTAFASHRRLVVSTFGILVALALPNWLDLPFLEGIAAQEGLAHLPRLMIRLIVASVFILLAALAALASKALIGRPRDVSTKEGLQAGALSEREKEVLIQLAWGYSNKEIAANLTLSTKTVETYRVRIGEKLGLRTRAEMVRYALREGWLNETSPHVRPSGL